MEIENPDKDKERLKRLFKDLFDRMFEGCGREICLMENCRRNPSSPQNLTKEQTAKKALDLIKTSRTFKLCTLLKDRKVIPRQIIEKYSENPETLGEFFPLARDIFMEPEILNDSFYINNGRAPGRTSPLLDCETLDKFVAAISKAPNEICELYKGLFRDSIKKLEFRMKDKAQGQQFIEDLQLPRVIYVLLRISFLFDSVDQDKTLMKLAINLDSDQKQILSNWFANESKEHLEMVIEGVQTLITIDIYNIFSEDEEMTEDEENRHNENIGNSIRFLEIIYNANAVSKLIPREKFYNPAFIDIEDQMLKHHPLVFGHTELKKYPWILDIGFRSKMLARDARQSQNMEVRNFLLHRMHLFMPLSIDAIFLQLVVRRDHLIEDTLNFLNKTNVNFRRPLQVKFEGEQGIDDGGVRKEFFQLIIKQLFDPDYGMFIPRKKNTLLWINGHSLECQVNFELIGMILGLSIYNSVNLDLHFPLIIYKKLLDQPIELKDLAEIEPELENGLQLLLNYTGNVEEDFMLTFHVIYNIFEQRHSYDLIENGEMIPVTNNNKEVFVTRYLKWYTEESIDKQFKAFYKGFKKIVKDDLTNLFRPEELHTLICGSSFLNFNDLETGAKYEEPFSKDHQVIRNLWAVVHSLNEDQKKRFLFFCTGSDRAPVRGLGELNLTISRSGPDSEHLPSAHTCYNHLLLPEYGSQEKLRNKLLTALENSEGFGLC